MSSDIPSGVNGDPWLTVIYDLRFLKDEWMLNLLSNTKYFCFRAHMIRNNEELTRFIDYIETPYITILTSEFSIDDMLYQRIRDKISNDYRPDVIIWSDYRIKSLENVNFLRTFSSQCVFRTDIVKETIHELREYNMDLMNIFAILKCNSFENIVIKTPLKHNKNVSVSNENIIEFNKLLDELPDNVFVFEKQLLKNRLYKYNYNILPVSVVINAINDSNINIDNIINQQYCPEEIHIITNAYNSKYSELHNVFIHFDNEIYNTVIDLNNNGKMIIVCNPDTIFDIKELYDKSNNFSENCLKFNNFYVPNDKNPIIIEPNSFKILPSLRMKQSCIMCPYALLSYCLKKQCKCETINEDSFTTNEDGVPLAIIAMRNLLS